jgi:type II secretory pathway pseudopilin PulG
MTPDAPAWVMRTRPSGFTLAETVISLGIVSFAIVSLIGLLAGGLQTAKESVEDVQAAHIATTILGQRRAAPTKIDPDFILPEFNDLTKSPILTGSGVAPYKSNIYLAQDGGQASAAADNYYRLDYTLSRNASGNLARVYISLTTPWQATPPDIQTPGANEPAIKTRFETITYIPVP